ncbi:MAG TPA: FecR family protein [Candidatus Limnocylindria bacterium]|nr:FecR family protein [Candidatus Limnocylindria bacterium]
MRIRVLIVALIAIGVIVPTVLVLSPQRAAGASMVLSVLRGSADVARGQTDFVRAPDGQVLGPGDRVRTADDGHAIVTFLDGSTVTIDPATTITIVEATATASGVIAIRLEQALGRTWSSVQKLAHIDSRFEIITPSTTATVRGTGFITAVSASGATAVTTTDGIVEVSAQGQTVVVPAGSVTTVLPGASPAPPVPAPAARNTLRFGLHSPAYVLVVDPLGRSCGIASLGATVVRQIPGCLATEPGIEPQLLDIADAVPGTYNVVIESIAPGGDFVATASAVDATGALSFNYSVGGGGPTGTLFGTSLSVEVAANGSLSAPGLSKLVLVDRPPSRIVVLSPLPRPTAAGTPNPNTFPLLPRFGFTAGIEVTPAPAARTALPSPTPSDTPSPSPTENVTPDPTPAPTTAPVRTLPPPPPPTPTPAPTATPTPPPTPAPTPSPAPTATGPSVTAGLGSAGNPVTINGRGWSTARITLYWEDGAPLAQVTANAAGEFALAWTVPINLNVGFYAITASDGLRSASGQLAVYAPALFVSCTTADASVSLRGNGWPASARYTIRSSLLATPLSGTIAADGTFSTSFTPPAGTLPGDYQFQASTGTLLAPVSSCTLR